MANSRIPVLRGGVELAALLTLLWLFYPIVIPSHVAAMDEVGMCVSTANHSLELKEIRFQEGSRTTDLVVEETSATRTTLVVLLEGTGSSTGGLYYANWRGELHVWSWKFAYDC